MKTPLLTVSLAFLCCLPGAGTLAMDRTDDPLGRTPTLVESSEFVIVWGVPGQSSNQKLYDFLPLPTPNPDGHTGIIDLSVRGEESGDWGLYGRGELDVATASFDGEGFDDLVAVWEGPNRSINVFIPDIDANTLSWTNANRVNLSDSIWTQMIDLAVGDFDADWQDEFIVAYVGTDQYIHLQLLDPEGTSMPVVHGSVADEPTLPNQANMNRYSFAVATGDLDGDRDHEIILVGIDHDWDGEGLLNDWGLYAKIYDVTRLAGTLELQPKGRTIFFKKPMQSDPSIFELVLSVTTGDFDNDTVDEVAVLTVFLDNDEQGSYEDTFLQILETNRNLGPLQDVSLGGDQRGLFTSSRRPGATVISGDISLDGRDEIIYSVNSEIHVFSVDESTQESEPQHILTPHFREVYFSPSTGNDDHQYSHTVLAVDNMDGADDEDADTPEIVAVYNRHSGAVDGEQLLEMFVHTIEDPSIESWKALRRTEFEDEIAPGGGGSGGRRHFAMAMGDFDGDRIRVGDPEITNRTEVRQPLVVLNAPPVHFDVLGGTQYDINQCFGGGSCGFTSTYEQSQTLEVGITTNIHSEWCVDGSLGASGNIYGVKVGAKLTETYGEGFKNVATKNFSVSMRTTVVATEDDIVYASVADYNLWEYPVFADGELRGYIMAIDPVWNGNVWIPSKSPETGADFRPDHEPGNILSYQEYPDSLQQNSNVAELIRGSNSESFILNDTQNFEWFLKFRDFEENTVEESWNSKTTGSVEVAIAEATGTYNTGEISTSTTTVTEELSLKVNLGQVDLGLGRAQYRVTPYTYWSESGAMVVDYAVRPERALQGEDPTWWDEQYGQEPDPGFLMRWRYDEEKGRAVSDRQKQRTNQISFTKPDLIRGEVTTITARVHNLSLTDMVNPVAVRFYLDDPDQGGQLIQSTTSESEVILDPVVSRGFGLAEMEWRVPDGEERFLTVYAVIDPSGQIDEIHENNNKGWTVLGINDDVTPVELTGFQVLAQLGQMVLSWSPSSESDHSGFHVWRAPSEGGEHVRITESLLQRSYRFVDESVVPGQTYSYKLEALDRSGQSVFFGPLLGTALETGPRLVLAQNSPNPFGASTSIRYQIPRDTRVRLVVYDIGGRLVRHLLDEKRLTGAHEIVWDGKDEQGRRVGSGMYFYRLQIPQASRTGRMLLIR